MPERIALRAAAKLNLFLRVMGRHEDGFHELETIFHGVALTDLVQLSAGRPGSIQVEMTGSAAMQTHVPVPEDNLVNIAASQMASLAKTEPGATIVVDKSIPFGGGLAGGSADAAATIVGLNELWELDLTLGSMLGIAAGLGSDVPYCIEGGTVLATGRGTELARLPEPAPMWFVLGMSDRPLLTGEVFAAWDENRQTGGVPADGLIAALIGGDVAEIGSHIHNDLLIPAVTTRPEIEAGLQALLDAGAAGAGMSGSGPTVFGIARGETDAHEIAQSVRNVFSRVQVRASSPVGVERV
ncbi:MAG: 4-diphosphocytidyl-2-C-methyl-D-erythritol kinase [Actinomycetota bacterium]|jgi:4-diphosphocytidyl-2-C-methyl-D-erythritol kinase|nr:4-diphosphocytidyl-2-C-methyl-D-erythritol kinase [Actinomycetota bacterium]